MTNSGAADQRVLDQADVRIVQVAVSSKTNGATPLVIASKNGHLQAVEFLISELHADVEQVSGDCDESQEHEFKDRIVCMCVGSAHTCVRLMSLFLT